MAEPTPVVINPTPKQQFMASSRKVSAHRNTMQMEPIQEGLNMAMLQYQLLLATSTQDSNGAAAAMFKIKGALEFIDVFLKLGESPKIQADSGKVTQLNHQLV